MVGHSLSWNRPPLTHYRSHYSSFCILFFCPWTKTMLSKLHIPFGFRMRKNRQYLGRQRAFRVAENMTLRCCFVGKTPFGTGDWKLLALRNVQQCICWMCMLCSETFPHWKRYKNVFFFFFRELEWFCSIVEISKYKHFIWDVILIVSKIFLFSIKNDIYEYLILSTLYNKFYICI